MWALGITNNTWFKRSLDKRWEREWGGAVVEFLTLVPVGNTWGEEECVWNVMAPGDAQEGKWRGNWRMQWVASTLHTTSEHGVSSITTADVHTSAAGSRLNWRPRANLNGLVRFAERRNLVSERVPSHFKRSLPEQLQSGREFIYWNSQNASNIPTIIIKKFTHSLPTCVTTCVTTCLTRCSQDATFVRGS